MRTRNGKIARLPQAVREELNQRLERSESSTTLLAWLNALPEARALVEAGFHGTAVSKHNLSQWRRGGYQDWLMRRDFFSDVRNVDDFAAEQQLQPSDQRFVDHTATVLAVRYGNLVLNWDGKCTENFKANAQLLNGICRGVVQLQREAKKTAPSHPVAASSS